MKEQLMNYKLELIRVNAKIHLAKQDIVRMKYINAHRRDLENIGNYIQYLKDKIKTLNENKQMLGLVIDVESNSND